jgi:hypothetical protein
VRFAIALARPSRRAAALRVQAVEPSLRNDVESSLELAPLLQAPAPGVSAPLVGALVATTGDRLEFAAARRFASWRSVRSGALLLAVAFVPLCARLTAASHNRGAGADRPARAWPPASCIAVEPGTRAHRPRRSTCASGWGATMESRSSIRGMGRERGGGSTRRVSGPALVARLAISPTGCRERNPAHGTASGSTRGGELRDALHLSARNLPSRTTAGTGEVEAEGDLGRNHAPTSADVAEASIVFGANRVPVRPAGERLHRAVLYLNGESSYRVELQDAGGLTNGAGQEYPVRYLPDAPPIVEITEPTGEIEGDPRGMVAVRYRAADDYGLSRLALVSSSSAGERRLPRFCRGARGAGGSGLISHRWGPAGRAHLRVRRGGGQRHDFGTESRHRGDPAIADLRPEREEAREKLPPTWCSFR